MSKWFGKIGFSETVDIGNGVWKNSIVEKKYYGDITKNYTNYQLQSDKVIDNIDISNELSIISNHYANENYSAIKYAEVMGTKWRVKKVELRYPRLILILGGVYNG